MKQRGTYGERVLLPPWTRTIRLGGANGGKTTGKIEFPPGGLYTQSNKSGSNERQLGQSFAISQISVIAEE